MPQLSKHTIQAYTVGVDVGGTKVAASLVDLHGQLHGKSRSTTDISTPEATLDGIARTINLAIESAGISRSDIRGIGLGIPGTVDSRLGIGLASVNLNWRNVAVVEGLQHRLHLPCRIENDVRVAGLGEFHFGAGKGKKNLVFLTIGTGVAAALILDGKLWHGSHGLAGEIGHVTFDPGGPKCKCGGKGCLEALISGPAIAARARAKTQDTGISQLRTDPDLTAGEVFEAASLGDDLAKWIVEETCAYMARAIQWLALSYDPQVVVLGGGVTEAGELLLEPLRRQMQRLAQESWVFGELFTPELVQISQLGQNNAILGAAALFSDE